jgi:glycosyltransferase involved in cell wall biosynthesis
MRIVHVIRSDGWAGVERHVSELALAQLRLGDQVTVVGGDPARMAAAVGPDIRVLPAARTAGVTLALSRLGGSFDVVNTHMTAADLGATLSPRHRSATLVSTRHFAAPRGATPLLRPVVRAMSNRLDGQIAVSRYVADRVDGPSAVVLSGVPADDGRVPAADRASWVLVAQRLEAEKRTDVALRAFALSGLARQGWRLRVCGKGVMLVQLARLCRELDVEDAVEFLGHRSDVHDLMRKSSVFLASRPDEAFGLSVVEAMARGLPVVAAGSGAHLETVGSVPGAALFAPGDPGDAARLLKELASDVERRDDYGRQLQDAQREHFTVDIQARNTDAAYRSFG